MGNNKLVDKGTGVIKKLIVDEVKSTFNSFAITPKAKYVSGARVVLKINDSLMGFSFGVSWEISTDYREINTIDDYQAWELVPNRISVSGTISGFHLPHKSPTLIGIQSDVLSFLFDKYLTIEVRDSATNVLLFFTNKAVIVNRSEVINAESLATLNLRFKAIGFKEGAFEFPTNYDKKTEEAKKDAAFPSSIDDIGPYLEDKYL
jgi:hypothetical protein